MHNNNISYTILRPQAIKYAFQLCMASLAFTLIYYAVSVASINSAAFRNSLMREYPRSSISYNRNAVEAMVGAEILTLIILNTFFVITILACTLLVALLAFNTIKASRILAIIFASLGAIPLFFVFSVFLVNSLSGAIISPLPIIIFLIFLLAYMAFLAATIILWLEPSTRYFKQRVITKRTTLPPPTPYVNPGIYTPNGYGPNNPGRAASYDPDKTWPST